RVDIAFGNAVDLHQRAAADAEAVVVECCHCPALVVNFAPCARKGRWRSAKRVDCNGIGQRGIRSPALPIKKAGTGKKTSCNKRQPDWARERLTQQPACSLASRSGLVTLARH